MRLFNIGDKIIYPMHGAGIIESIEEKEVLGKKKKYYIMRLPIDNMKVMIPIDSIDDFGIRNIISYDDFGSVIDIFKKNDGDFTDGWNKRYRNSMNKLKSGDIYGIAEVVKELMQRDIRKGLSPGEKKILENAESILYSELMLVTGLPLNEVKKIIKEQVMKNE